jgi:DNA replication protein DnaC
MAIRVLFMRTTDLVQRLQLARQNLSLEAMIEKLGKCHLMVLDDLCCIRKDQAETSVLFDLIAARYERRSLLVTSNQPFPSGRACSPGQPALLGASPTSAARVTTWHN